MMNALFSCTLFFFFFLLKKNGVPIIIHPFTCCSFKILGAARGWANVSFQRGLPACLLSGLADVLCILFYFFSLSLFSSLFSTPLTRHVCSCFNRICCLLRLNPFRTSHGRQGLPWLGMAVSYGRCRWTQQWCSKQAGQSSTAFTPTSWRRRRPWPAGPMLGGLVGWLVLPGRDHVLKGGCFS